MYRGTAVLPLKLDSTGSGDPQSLPLTFPHESHPTQSFDPRRDLFSDPDDEMRDILSVLNPGDQDAAAGDGPRMSAAEEAAEKKRKHREAMVLFRLRKKMNFEDMRKKEQTLQDVLQAKLQQYHQLRDRKTPNSEDKLRMRELVDQFADVLTVKESLLRENRAMESVIAELSKFQKLVQDEVERRAEEEAQAATASPSGGSPTSKTTPSADEWVRFLDNEAPFLYLPVPQESGAELVRDSFQRSMELRALFELRGSDVTETFCMGWKAQRSVVVTEDKMQLLRFRFTRQVPRWFMAFDDYKRLAWPVVTTPELNTRLYSSPVHMKLLQWIDQDSFITLRNSPHRDRGIHIRYFASNARFEYVDEKKRRNFIIHHTILDPELLAHSTEGSGVVWIKDGVQAMNFTEMPENDTVEIEHMGFMQCLNEEQARYLMVETCSILMRWEQFVVPPRLLSSD